MSHSEHQVRSHPKRARSWITNAIAADEDARETAEWSAKTITRLANENARLQDNPTLTSTESITHTFRMLVNPDNMPGEGYYRPTKELLNGIDATPLMWSPDFETGLRTRFGSSPCHAFMEPEKRPWMEREYNNCIDVQLSRINTCPNTFMRVKAVLCTQPEHYINDRLVRGNPLKILIHREVGMDDYGCGSTSTPFAEYFDITDEMREQNERRPLFSVEMTISMYIKD